MRLYTFIALSLIGQSLFSQVVSEDRSFEKTYYYNYIDDAETVVAETKVYFDVLERPTQSMVRLIEEDKVAVMQQLYDLRGKPTLTTLPGIRNTSDMVFDDNFILNTDGLPYSASDFDGPNLNSPSEVSSTAGTLGSYYGEANVDETHVPKVDFPFVRSWTDHSPDPRTSKQGLPGNSMTLGSGRELQSRVEPTTTADYNDYLQHYYALKSHFVTSGVVTLEDKGYKSISTSPDGKESVVFSDVDGNQIATALITDTGYAYWSYTYYDDLGRTVAEVAPNGIDFTDIVNKPGYTTEYEYNNRGWLVAMASPDEGRSEFVYSRDGKLRFSQSQLQREASPQRFSYSHYDGMQRLIESGEYTTANSGTDYLFESHANATSASNSIHDIVDMVGADGQLQDCEAGDPGCNKNWVSKVTYDYQTADFPIDASHPYQDFVEGQVAATENQQTKTWYSYDELGRMIFEVRWIKVLDRYVTIDYTYDFIGNLLQLSYQKDVDDERFHYHYVYDADQRLKQVYTSLDGDPNGISAWLHATYHYFLHGPLKRVELATDLQGIDYLYTAEGSLKSINAVDPAHDPGGDGSNDFPEDVMGIQYDYYPGDFERQNVVTANIPLDDNAFPASYDGNIRAMTWGRGEFKPAVPAPSVLTLPTYDPAQSDVAARQRVELIAGFSVTGGQTFHASTSPTADMPTTPEKVKTYAYAYDERDQMEKAVYGEDGVIDESQLAFGVKDLDYDDNGNITTLKRYDNDGNALHDFTYAYVPGKNQLDYVTGYANYGYDALGRLDTVDYDDSSIPDMYLSYDVSDRVVGVYATANRLESDLRVSFSYDDRGYRLMKKDHVLNIETWYVRDASGNVLHYYHRVNDTFIQGAYPLYGSGRIGMAFRYPDHLKYNYEITDHQGNVRQVVSKLKYMAVATMETTEPNKSWEEGEELGGFQNMDTRHQDQIVNTTPDGSHSAWLNHHQNGKAVGPAKELKVSSGDKIKMSVNAAYLIPDSDNSIIDNFSSLVAMAMGFDPGLTETTQKIAIIDEALTSAAAIPLSAGGVRDPRAYLRYLFFDKNFNYVAPGGSDLDFAMVTSAAGNTSQQLQDAGQVNHELLELEFDVPEDGYVYIYVANEGDNDVSVYFDDLTIQHLGIDVIQATDYYPFGSVMNQYADVDGNIINDQSGQAPDEVILETDFTSELPMSVVGGTPYLWNGQLLIYSHSWADEKGGVDVPINTVSGANYGVNFDLDYQIGTLELLIDGQSVGTYSSVGSYSTSFIGNGGEMTLRMIMTEDDVSGTGTHVRLDDLSIIETNGGSTTEVLNLSFTQTHHFAEPVHNGGVFHTLSLGNLLYQVWGNSNMLPTVTIPAVDKSRQVNISLDINNVRGIYQVLLDGEVIKTVSDIGNQTITHQFQGTGNPMSLSIKYLTELVDGLSSAMYIDNLSIESVQPSEPFNNQLVLDESFDYPFSITQTTGTSVVREGRLQMWSWINANTNADFSFDVPTIAGTSYTCEFDFNQIRGDMEVTVDGVAVGSYNQDAVHSFTFTGTGQPAVISMATVLPVVDNKPSTHQIRSIQVRETNNSNVIVYDELFNDFHGFSLSNTSGSKVEHGHDARVRYFRSNENSQSPALKNLPSVPAGDDLRLTLDLNNVRGDLRLTIDGQEVDFITTTGRSLYTYDLIGTGAPMTLGLQYLTAKVNGSNSIVDLYSMKLEDLSVPISPVGAEGSGAITGRYQKENYGYGYQGQYAEEDVETGWNSFDLRMYDPVIARWISPDPYREFYSPYLAMGNSPTLVDPDGGGTKAPDLGSSGPGGLDVAQGIMAASEAVGSMQQIENVRGDSYYSGGSLGGDDYGIGTDPMEEYVSLMIEFEEFGEQFFEGSGEILAEYGLDGILILWALEPSPMGEVALAQRHISVIGPRATYRQFAKEAGANFLNVTDEAWTWLKNEEFLAGVVQRGDDVVFAGKFNPAKLDPTSVLAKEIEYLSNHGYKWVDDFSKMIK